MHLRMKLIIQWTKKIFIGSMEEEQHFLKFVEIFIIQFESCLNANTHTSWDVMEKRHGEQVVTTQDVQVATLDDILDPYTYH